MNIIDALMAIMLLSNLSLGSTYSAFDSASWAVTSDVLSTMLGVEKQSLYDNFISACNEAIVSDNICNTNDQSRMRMNKYQPKSVYNYTKDGYAKTRVPSHLFRLIKNFFDDNRHKAEIEWKEYNVYHNAWESPPTIIHINRSPSLKSNIEETIKPILEDWTGNRLAPVSTYGIRLYHNGSILAPHVDRMPLITSVIIQVDQDVDEPWALEVYGHDGKATNITMEPGDMVLYESHSVIHGRPFPMRGDFFANLFIHFEPYAPKEGKSSYDPNNDIPPYLVNGSEWEKEWRMANPNGWKSKRNEDLRTLVIQGNVMEVEARASDNPEYLHEADVNGWTVLHEAVRVGKLEMVKLLLAHGADKDLLTKTGVSPLNIAREYLQPTEHELIQFLESIGAKDVSPSRNQEL